MFMNGSWRPLTATQHYTVSPPGFVWDARVNLAPMLPVLVRDQYVAGHGRLQASALGLFLVADQSSSRELDAGELQRFLGEAVWFPTALLPSALLTWSPVDEHSATATLEDNGTTAALTFEFDEARITAIRGSRYQENHGQYTLQPWLIACREHAPHEGSMIPRRCEVSWIVGGQPVPYWRGRIASVSYRYE